MSSEPSGPTRPERVSAVDVPYTFGRPASTYLSPREIVRVTILRSRLGAAADSEHAAAEVSPSAGRRNHVRGDSVG